LDLLAPEEGMKEVRVSFSKHMAFNEFRASLADKKAAPEGG
jgi:hypothetical protein